MTLRHTFHRSPWAPSASPVLPLPRWTRLLLLFALLFATEESIGSPTGSVANGVLPYRNRSEIQVDPSIHLQLANGQILVAKTDLTIPGVNDFHLEFSRFYRSQPEGVAAYDGPLGWNWDNNWNHSISFDGSNPTYYHPINMQTYDFESDGPNRYRCTASGVYVKIRFDGQHWQLRHREGTILTFHGFDGQATDGRLLSLQNRLGNTFQCSYDSNGKLIGVVDLTTLQSLTITWDQGKVNTVSDGNGRVIVYTRDPQGDLHRVRLPVVNGTPVNPVTGETNDLPQGTTTEYGYSTNSHSDPFLQHNLESVTYPREFANTGIRNVEIDYGVADSAYDRAESITTGQLTHSVTYDGFVTTLSHPGATVSYNEYAFQPSGHVASITETEDTNTYTTSFSYNTEGEITAQVFPSGKTTVNTFDIASANRFHQGNLIQVRTTSGTGAAFGSRPHKTKFDYEPVYLHPANKEDPGQVLFDYQEGNPAPGTGILGYAESWGITLSPDIPLDQGDLNQDGSDSQWFGNVIKEHLDVTVNGSSVPAETYRTYNSHGQLVTVCTPEGSLTIREYDSRGYLETTIVDANPANYPASPNAGTDNWDKPGVDHVEAITRFARDPHGWIESTTTPRGVTHRYDRDEHGRVLRLTYGESAVMGIDSALDGLTTFPQWQHLITPGIDIYYHYDENGNVVRQDQEVLRSSSLTQGWLTQKHEYNLQNQVTKTEHEIQEGTWAITEYEFDDRGDLIRVHHPENNYDEYTYERGLVKTYTQGASDPTKSTTTGYVYDLDRNLVELHSDRDGDGVIEKTLFRRDGRGRLREKIDPVGTRHFYIYNNQSKQVGYEIYGQLGGPSPTDNNTSGNVLLSKVSMVYDQADRITKETRTRFVHGSVGIPYSPSGDQVIEYEYDRDGQLTGYSTPSSGMIHYEYDGLNRLIQFSDPQGNSFERAYDLEGNLVKDVEIEVGGETKVYVYSYDGLNRVIRATNTMGETYFFAYDSLNNLVAETDCKNPGSIPDLLGAFPPAEAPPGIHTINLPGNMKRYLPNGLGLVERVESDMTPSGSGITTDLWSENFDPEVSPTGTFVKSTFAYDANGNLRSSTGENNTTTSFHYDDQDRLTRKTFSDGSYHDFAHWTDHRIRSKRLHKADGTLFREVLFHYDSIGRMVSTATSGTGVVGSHRTYQHNGLDYVTLATDDNGGGSYFSSSVSRSYDSLGNLIEETQTHGGLSPRTVNFDYDTSGNRTKMWYPSSPYGPGARQITYQFVSVGLVESITDQNGDIADYSFLSRLRPADVTLGGGVASIDYQNPAAGSPWPTGYDGAGRLLNLEHLAGGSVAGGIVESYDRLGNRQQSERIHGSTNQVDTYDYDSLSRVREYQRNIVGGGTPEWNQSYDLRDDGSFRELEISVNGASSQVHTFANSGTGSYTQIDSLALQTDQAGNRTQDHWFDFHYDAHDRLRLIEDRLTGSQSLIARYSYDAFGRRIAKDIGTGVTHYFHAGDQVIEEADASGALQAQYVYGNGLDEPLQMIRDTDGSFLPFYYLRNSLGSIVALVDESGAVVERYSYDAFGAPTFLDGAGTPVPGQLRSQFSNPYLFTAREYDSETAEFRATQSPAGYFAEWSEPSGQYYYRHRYYDPAEGRFTGRDKLLLTGNTSLDPALLLERVYENGGIESPYAYASNNPSNLTDAMGLQATGQDEDNGDGETGEDPEKDEDGPIKRILKKVVPKPKWFKNGKHAWRAGEIIGSLMGQAQGTTTLGSCLAGDVNLPECDVPLPPLPWDVPPPKGRGSGGPIRAETYAAGVGGPIPGVFVKSCCYGMNTYENRNPECSNPGRPTSGDRGGQSKPAVPDRPNPPAKPQSPSGSPKGTPTGGGGSSGGGGPSSPLSPMPTYLVITPPPAPPLSVARPFFLPDPFCDSEDERSHNQHLLPGGQVHRSSTTRVSDLLASISAERRGHGTEIRVSPRYRDSRPIPFSLFRVEKGENVGEKVADGELSRSTVWSFTDREAPLGASYILGLKDDYGQWNYSSTIPTFGDSSVAKEAHENMRKEREGFRAALRLGTFSMTGVLLGVGLILGRRRNPNRGETQPQSREQ